MRHPLVNADDRISYFRVVCLLVLAGCMLTYGVMSLLENHPTPLTTERAQEQVQHEEPKEPEQPPTAPESRELMLVELHRAEQFMHVCGGMNGSYLSCNWQLDQELIEDYSSELIASEDGFSLTVKTLKPGFDPKCSLMRVDSNGLLFAQGEDGTVNYDCFEHYPAQDEKDRREN